MVFGSGWICVAVEAWPSWDYGPGDLQRAAECSARDFAILKRICPEMSIPKFLRRAPRSPNLHPMGSRPGPRGSR